jgi:hypothetical protein
LVFPVTFADSIWTYASATRPTKTHPLFSPISRDLLCGRQLCRLLLEHQTFQPSSLFAATLPSRRTTNASYSFPPPPHATKSTTITYLKRDSTSYSM